MLLGIIADDLTGASDIAGFVAKEGFNVIQFVGVPAEGAEYECDAAVISLKSRSTPAAEAVKDSLAALSWLRARGCQRIYFKYCSTFDSTPKGNIGPVTDALLDVLGQDITVVCPSLPVNGRTVRDGVLYVNGVPLSESGMRHHPLNPMTDSDLQRLMEGQSKGKAGLVDHSVVAKGPDAVKARMDELRAAGVRYAVVDAETDGELDILAAAFADAPLLTGGSGLGGMVAKQLVAREPAKFAKGKKAGPAAGKTIVLSGSCSEMTNKQVAAYAAKAPLFKVEVEKCRDTAADYAAEAAAWAELQANGPAPLISATVSPGELKTIQERFGGSEAAEAVEHFFRLLAIKLHDLGYVNFIVAGGETSGSVAGVLGVGAFRIGPEIAPGVSWVYALDSDLALAMKSGNFGDESFFTKAQDMIHD